MIYTKRISLQQTENGSYEDFDVEYQIVDNGIGAYEFWGAKGVDRQDGIEVLDITKSNLIMPVPIPEDEYEFLAEQVYDKEKELLEHAGNVDYEQEREVE
jgi:hypothetical protein